MVQSQKCDETYLWHYKLEKSGKQYKKFISHFCWYIYCEGFNFNHCMDEQIVFVKDWIRPEYLNQYSEKCVLDD